MRWQSPPTARETADRDAYFASRPYIARRREFYPHVVELVRETIYGTMVYAARAYASADEATAVLAVTIPTVSDSLGPVITPEDN